jgi:hypothetical protein
LIVAMLLGACDESDEGIVGTNDTEVIALVADGSFETYPEEPIGAAADCYFDSVAWGSLLAIDNHTYVNLEGCGVDGDESEATLQFRVFRGTATFTLHAMELNGVGQPDSLVLVLVDDMIACEP